MKIQIYSDLHTDINCITDPKEILDTSKNADLYIDAGDTGEYVATESFYNHKFWKNKKVLFVAGNHTHYNHANLLTNQESLKQQFSAQNNVTYLQDDEIIIGDCVFLGCTLWTDYKVFDTPNLSKRTARKYMNDFRYIEFDQDSYLTPECCQTLNSLSLKYLHKRLEKFKGKKKAVVITHHSPSIKSCLPKYKYNDLSASFASNFEDFIQNHEIFLWIHGHMHNLSSYKIGETYVICNPLGYIKYGEDSGFVNNLVIDI